MTLPSPSIPRVRVEEIHQIRQEALRFREQRLGDDETVDGSEVLEPWVQALTGMTLSTLDRQPASALLVSLLLIGVHVNERTVALAEVLSVGAGLAESAGDQALADRRRQTAEALVDAAGKTRFLAGPTAGGQEIQVSWDLDGLTAALPGIQMSMRDNLTTLALLGGGTDVLIGLTFALQWFRQGGLDFAQVWIMVALMVGTPLMFAPFLWLGWLRGAGSPVTVQIQPNGQLRYTWLGGDVTHALSMQSLASVTVPSGGEPRVVLAVRARQGNPQAPQEWRVRTWDHARWLADQLTMAQAQIAGRQGESGDVPQALSQLRSAKAVAE